MMKWIVFGKNLQGGIKLYNEKRFSDAQTSFQKAVSINANDFIVNYWLMKVSVVLWDFSEAQKYMGECLRLQPDVEKTLIDPWRSSLNSLKNSECVDLQKIDDETTVLLNGYQQIRNFSIWETLALWVAGALFYTIGYSIENILLNDFTDLEFVESAIVPFFSIAITILATIYYYIKPKILPNVWIAINLGILQFKHLCHNRGFLWVCLMVLLPTVPWEPLTINSEELIAMKNTYKSLDLSKITLYLISAPIYEEILFRGMLFNNLKKYNRVLAYVIVALLFYGHHFDEAVLSHFIHSLFYCWVYEKYDTILAPLLIHMSYNHLITLKLTLVHIL